MREDVCITLNEREPLKAQLAEELEFQLEKRRLSCKRLNHTDCSPDVILERGPRVVVCDYLLGEVSTALDLLTMLQKPAPPPETRVIVWTDEPSVNVAVGAMKLGAYDYLELSVNSSLDKVLQAIESCLFLLDTSARQPKRASHTETLIAQSKLFQETLTRADALAFFDRIIRRSCNRMHPQFHKHAH